MWRVLSDPAAAAAWLPSFGGWIYEPRASLSARGELRFRSRLCGVPVQADVRVLEVKPGCLRGLVRFGLLACEAKFSFSPEPGVAGVTRIGLVLSIENRIALVGGTLDRFEVRRLASGLAEQVLGGLSAQAEEFARLIGGERRPLRTEAGGLLERVRELQHAEVVPAAADDLDADGQPFRREAGGH